MELNATDYGLSQGMRLSTYNERVAGVYICPVCKDWLAYPAQDTSNIMIQPLSIICPKCGVRGCLKHSPHTGNTVAVLSDGKGCVLATAKAKLHPKDSHCYDRTKGQLAAVARLLHDNPELTTTDMCRFEARWDNEPTPESIGKAIETRVLAEFGYIPLVICPTSCATTMVRAHDLVGLYSVVQEEIMVARLAEKRRCSEECRKKALTPRKVWHNAHQSSR